MYDAGTSSSRALMSHRPHWRRIAAAVGVVACLFVGGCASSVVTQEVGQCSPSYEISQPGVGRVSIQQAGRGARIQWGIYVEDARYKFGTQFTVKAYADGQTVDGKNQGYEPHSSISGARALKYSGKLLEITGTATHGDDQLFFSAKCYIA